MFKDVAYTPSTVKKSGSKAMTTSFSSLNLQKPPQDRAAKVVEESAKARKTRKTTILNKRRQTSHYYPTLPGLALAVPGTQT